MDRLAAMEIFVSVAEAGSFSAAAKRMNVGQPAISKSVAQLEERLGGPVAFVSTVKLRKAGFNAAVDTRDAFCDALQSFIDRKLLPPAR